MKQTKLLMGMPITVEVVARAGLSEMFARVFDYFRYVDEKFSTYKETSEISRINRHEIVPAEYSQDMAKVFALSQRTRQDTDGFFDIRQPDGSYDPSGLVKGWAISNAATILGKAGYPNYYVEAGGDIEVAGKNSQGQIWRVGIKNPFNEREIVKALELQNKGIATSGTYLRGRHIYNPKNPGQTDFGIVSLTVIGPNAYEADRFATAAFAMGKAGIDFINKLDGFEGYMIDQAGIATFTDQFENYVAKAQ